MFLFVLPSEQRVANKEFKQNATKTPHVNSESVGDPHNYFWSSVKSTLNVSVDLFILKTAGAKVDYFNSRLIYLPKENILRLQVAVDDFVFLHIEEGNENLYGKSLDEIERKSLELVHLDKLIKVDGEHLESHAEMASKDELVGLAYDVLLVLWVVLVEMIDQLGFDQALLVESFLVPEHFEGHKFLVSMVVTL